MISAAIEMRKRFVGLTRYQKLLQKATPKEDPPWYRKWLMGEPTEVPGVEELAKAPIADEQSSHMILEAIDTDAQNELQKHADDYPGLTLLPSMHRVYPFGAVACHVIGHLSESAERGFGQSMRFSGAAEQGIYIQRRHRARRPGGIGRADPSRQAGEGRL